LVFAEHEGLAPRQRHETFGVGHDGKLEPAVGVRVGVEAGVDDVAKERAGRDVFASSEHEVERRRGELDGAGEIEVLTIRVEHAS
jgi:hypothetical protein